jgi:galactokinase
VSLVKTEKIENVSEFIRKNYHFVTGIEPTLFATRPAPGAAVL